MPAAEPLRVYVSDDEEKYAKLFWIHNNKPNEMLLGFYNLKGEPATITHQFPERQLSASESGDRRFEYSEAIHVADALDHFTCHLDGTFHAKTRHSRPLYMHVERRAEPIGVHTPPFLDLLLVSDRIGSYTKIAGKPKPPNVWLRSNPNVTLTLNLRFSGVEYPLEQEVIALAAARNRPTSVVTLVSGTIRGAIWGGPLAIDAGAVSARPQGTLVVFTWPRESGMRGFKAFFVN